MSKAWSQLYYHLVWARLRREPMIPQDLEADLYRYIGSRGIDYGYQILEVNGISDHLHVVASLPPTVSVTEAVGKLKGSSSHFMRSGLSVSPFGWQQGYGAVTVSPRGLDYVRDYVKNQKAHHEKGTVHQAFEQLQLADKTLGDNS